jgi:hypothetical protein
MLGIAGHDEAVTKSPHPDPEKHSDRPSLQWIGSIRGLTQFYSVVLTFHTNALPVFGLANRPVFSDRKEYDAIVFARLKLKEALKCLEIDVGLVPSVSGLWNFRDQDRCIKRDGEIMSLNGTDTGYHRSSGGADYCWRMKSC